MLPCQKVNESKYIANQKFLFLLIDFPWFYLQSEQNIVASFDRKGEYIYTGNSKGKVSREFNFTLQWLLSRSNIKMNVLCFLSDM